MAVTVFTIGFTKKTAEIFFELLRKNNVKKLVDIRLNNASQLAGFAKSDDLKYFLKAILGIEYFHIADFAPTKDILDDYKKKKITWAEYEKKFNELLASRKVTDKYNILDFDKACFLCSEDSADKCHRRLLVESFKHKYSDLEIIHLK